MQPRSGKHRPLPGGISGFASSSPIPDTPLELGSSPGRPQEGFGRLQDVSPNVPLLALSFPSPGIKPSGSPGTNPRSTFSGVKTHSPQLGGPLGTFTASPGSWLADFGELADCSKLGELPGEEDLMLKLYETEPLDTSIHIKVAAYPAAAAAPSQVPGPYLTSAGPQPSNHHLKYYEQPPPQQPYNHVGLTWVPHQGFDQGFSGVPVPLQLPHPAQPAMPMGTEHLNPYYTYPLPRNLSRNPSVDPMQLRAHLPSPGVTPPPERIKRQAEYFDPSPVARRRQRVSGGYSHGSNSSRKQQQIVDDPGANTGKTYRGVSRHRLTQRWEASLWLNGRQLYLGGFDAQIDAARAYDLAALACKGPDAVINFSPEEYDDQLREIEGFSREEVVAYVRRRSAAFSRGKSKYRGVSGHNGRWEARIGSFNGRKNVSFGVFDTEEGAARQYDRALILEKGRSAKTNFPLRDYEAEVEIYKAHMARACGHLPRGSTALLHEVQAYTLPRDRVATADEKKRSAIIYGEALRQALEEN